MVHRVGDAGVLRKKKRVRGHEGSWNGSGPRFGNNEFCLFMSRFMTQNQKNRYPR